MSAPLYSCGHPRTPENTWGKQCPRCRTCRSARRKDSWAQADPADRYLEQRVRYLPTAIARTRRKLAALECEAARYGMKELLSNPEHLNRAWDETIREAQVEAAFNGDSIGFGEALRGVGEA